MKTLVIHPKDSTTDFLSEIYSDKDWTVINENPSTKKLKELIKSHDRIVMLGHGTERGLIGFKRLVINSGLVYLLREKICVCVWCNADIFVNKYGLKGFYTGMIISEVEESWTYSIKSDYDEIVKSNLLFSQAIKESIDSDNIVDNIKKTYNGDTPLITFNKGNLYEN